MFEIREWRHHRFSPRSLPIHRKRRRGEVSEDPRSKVMVSMTTGMAHKHLESPGRRTVYIYHTLVHS